MIAGNSSGSSPKRYLGALEEFFWKKIFFFEILWVQKGEILAFFKKFGHFWHTFHGLNRLKIAHFKIPPAKS